MVSTDQLTGLRFRLRSKTIFVDGTIHEKLRLLFEKAMFNWGDAGVFETQIPPPVEPSGSAAATNVFPSAEQAKAVQTAGGTLFDIQVDPPSLEL